MGRVSRSVDGWNERIALAETLNAKVISDLKIGCGFPTDHPLHAGAPASNAMVPEAIEALKAADVILALDWVDLAGGLRAALGLRAAQGQGDQCQRRLPHPQRLEHGLRDPAAGRPAAADNARRGGAEPAGGARRRQGAASPRR